MLDVDPDFRRFHAHRTFDRLNYCDDSKPCFADSNVPLGVVQHVFAFDARRLTGFLFRRQPSKYFDYSVFDPIGCDQFPTLAGSCSELFLLIMVVNYCNK